MSSLSLGRRGAVLSLALMLTSLTGAATIAHPANLSDSSARIGLEADEAALGSSLTRVSSLSGAYLACEFRSTAPLALRGEAGARTLRTQVGDNRSLLVLDPEHGEVSIAPHLAAPLVSGWVALAPGTSLRAHTSILESQALPWPAELTRDERAAILAELPEEGTSLSEPNWFHNAYGAKLTFLPLVKDGAGGLRYVRHARMVVDLAGQPLRSGFRPAAGRDGFESLYRRMFLNYDEGRAWRRTAADLASGSRRGATDSFGSSPNPWIRIDVDKEDVYAVTGQSLEDLGIDLGSVDVSTLRLFTGTGVAIPEWVDYTTLPSWLDELPIEVEAGEGLSLDPGDRILFYGVGPDAWFSQYGRSDTAIERHVRDQYSNTNTYWLTWGGSFVGGAPKRIAEVDGRGAEAPFATTALDRLHMEEDGVNEVFDSRPREYPGHGVPPFANWERFWWIGFRGEPNNNSFTIHSTIPDPVIDQPANVRLRLWGRNDTASHAQPPIPDHHMQVSLNGHAVGERIWNGIFHQDLEASGTWLTEGQQSFTFFQPLYVDSTVTARVDRQLLAWIELEYTRRLTAHDDTLSVFTGDWSGALSLEANGFSRDDVRVLDVSQARSPHWILADNESVGAARRLRFTYDATSQTEHPGRLLFRPMGRLAAPTRMVVDTKPDGGYLRDRTAPAQMIIIAHHDFLAQAEDLAAFRAERFPDRAHGDVAVVDVQDIYDEFSAGRLDPSAIRAFLQFARDWWTGGDPEEGPAYTLLLGDTHFDYRNLLHQGAVNYVPTFEGNYDPAYLNQVYAPQFGSDDYLAYLDGASDPALDVFMARIPVETVAQAQTVIDKIQRYETDSPLTPWKTRITLVADDRCQSVDDDPLYFTHTDQTEALAGDVLPRSLMRDKIYLLEYGDECQYTNKPAATDALTTSINEGTLVVNYTGHGSEGQLADERVLDLSSVGGLTNRDHLFFFVTASCSVGKYDQTSIGLAEALMRDEAGGAVGVFSAAAVATSTGNGNLNRNFFLVMFPSDSHAPARPIGEAAAVGKLRLGRPGDVNSRRFILMGDPAQTFQTPDYRLSMALRAGEAALGDTLPRGALVTLDGEVRDVAGSLVSGFTGTADVRVFDSSALRHFEKAVGQGIESTDYAMQGAPIYRGEAAVQDGRFTLEFHTPSALRIGPRGSAAIFAYAENGADDACASNDSLLVPERPAEPSTDLLPPEITLALQGDVAALPAGATYTATLFDQSGINITGLVGSRSVVQRIESNGELVSATEVAKQVSFGEDFRHATLTGSIPADLPSGRSYELVLEASDSFNNRASARTSFVLGAGGEGGFELAQIFNFPNPTEGETRFFGSLTASAEVEVKIFTTTGREIARLGPERINATELTREGIYWDGRDADGDQPGNGVYFYKMIARPLDGGKARESVGRLVISR